MPVTAKLRYLRIAPRKVRLVADLIRGKTAEEAQDILSFATKRAARPLLKLLNSAIASAVHDFHLEKSNLYISKILVNEGPKLKRWRARARGQAFEIQKKTSHVTIVLKEIEKKKGVSKKKIMRKKVRSFKKEMDKERVEKREKEERKEGKEGIMKKPKPRLVKGERKPKIPTGIKRVFRRKSFG